MRFPLLRLFGRKKPVFGKIVSGGQTGAERAALDAALELGLACGGWCPKGRISEEGAIPEIYPLQEKDSSSYIARIDANVKDSDGTMVFAFGDQAGGTDLTIKSARKRKKPLFLFDLQEDPSNSGLDAVWEWGRRRKISTLNVTGPRESQVQGSHAVVKDVMLTLLRMTLQKGEEPGK